MQRETYGYDQPEGQPQSPVKLLSLTRLIPTIPNGPQVYADSDGVVDVQMTDRFGRPWYMYRAREGYLGQEFDPGTRKYVLGMCRHTGILRNPGTPYYFLVSG